MNLNFRFLYVYKPCFFFYPLSFYIILMGIAKQTKSCRCLFYREFQLKSPRCHDMWGTMRVKKKHSFWRIPFCFERLRFFLPFNVHLEFYSLVLPNPKENILVSKSFPNPYTICLHNPICIIHNGKQEDKLWNKVGMLSLRFRKGLLLFCSFR